MINLEEIGCAALLVAVLMALLGYVMNIADLVGLIVTGSDADAGMIIVRAIGVFFTPLGSVLGFL